MPRLRSLLAAATLALGVAAATPASALTLMHTVGPQDNLYFIQWGHAFGDAVGTGVEARAVEQGGSAFNFAGLASVDVVATGCIVDAGQVCTDANGISDLFRGLPVYSLIGLWASGVGADGPTGVLGSPFFVGTANTLAVPIAQFAYLYLAENDGIFSDNTGSYDARLTVNEVPEPSTYALFGAGLLLLGAVARRRIG